MLISYRDSRRFPSETLALQTWVRLAELSARQVLVREFDPGQFARALEVCRRLTCTSGPESLKRIIHACAAAGVAVVVVPAIAGCHASSASRWLAQGRRRRAMIALSIRYRRDDQLYYSLFREAGAILAAYKRLLATESTECTENTENTDRIENASVGSVSSVSSVPESFSPDRFAREFIIPPEQDAEMASLIFTTESHGVTRSRNGNECPQCNSVRLRGESISALARKLQIAPGLLVGRLQHDGLISWKEHNDLKRMVDLSWVLRSAEALEETWPDQQTATRATMKDLNLDFDPARKRVARAAVRGELLTNGKSRCAMRIEPGTLAAWRLKMRDRDLDAEEREEAA